MEMQFNIEGKDVLLKRLAPPADKIVSEQDIFKQLQKKKEGALLQIYSLAVQDLQGTCSSKLNLGSSNSQLDQVLNDFKDIFDEPYGLPPPRSHDHVIPLKEGSNPVSVRPYRYPQF